MPINTAADRRAVAGVPFLPLTPGVTPDVTPGGFWRASVAWNYAVAGIVPPGGAGEGEDTIRLGVFTPPAAITRLGGM